MRLAEFRENITTGGIRQALADLIRAYPRSTSRLDNVYFADLTDVPAEVAETFRNLAKEIADDRSTTEESGRLEEGAG